MEVKILYNSFLIYAGYVSAETIRKYETAGFTVKAA